MTVAFVLSGAANYGSLQVGALQVLLERGIRPDMLMGTSAGALNAAYLAIDTEPDGAQRLADHWRNVGRDVLSRRDKLFMILRLIANYDGVMPNTPLRRFIERTLPPEAKCYGDLRLPAYGVAVRIDTGQLRCFGDHPADRLIDGLMASTAIPGFYPPWRCDGFAYVDGGVVAYLPIRLAIERGATEIYALNVNVARIQKTPPRGTLAIAGRALDLLIERQGSLELESRVSAPEIVVHCIELSIQRDIEFWDFNHADELVAAGREAAEAYLNARPAEHKPPKHWQDRLLAPFAPRQALPARRA